MSFFTVIIPTCNRPHLIERALRSLWNQTYSGLIDVIVVDAVPKVEETRSVVYDFLKIYRRVDRKLFYVKNTEDLVWKPAKCKNVALKHAEGKWITFLDDDDLYESNHLQNHFDILKDTENENILFYSSPTVLGNDRIPEQSNRGPNSKPKLVPISECKIGGTFFINKEWISKNFKNPFQIKDDYAHDYNFYKATENITNGKGIVKLNLNSYIYDRTATDNQITKNEAKIYNIF